MAKGSKKALNGGLAVGTLGTSVLVSKMFGAGRKTCPHCSHPLAWHERTANRQFVD